MFTCPLNVKRVHIIWFILYLLLVLLPVMSESSRDGSTPEAPAVHPKLAATDENAAKMDSFLELCRKYGWDLSVLEWHLYSNPDPGDPRNTSLRASMVPAYLKGEALLTPDKIVELQYRHKHAGNIKRRDSENRTAKEAKERDKETEKKKAHWLLLMWAAGTMEEKLSEEAQEGSSKSGGLHFADSIATWQVIHNFSVLKVLSAFEASGPFIFRMLRAAAFAPEDRPEPTLHIPTQTTSTATNQPSTNIASQPTAETSNQPTGATSDARQAEPQPTFAEHFSKPPPSGKGQNRSDPLLVSTH